MKRVLIAGCGDLGLELMRRLVQAEYEVMGVRRSSPTTSADAEMILADVTRPETLGELAIFQPDILVYCVAASEHSDESYRSSYVDGLRNVLHALATVSVQHIFFVSSTGVYGQETDAWLNEDDPAVATHFSGQRMLEAEALLSEYPASILRFSGIYGPGRTRMITLARNPAQWPVRNGWTNRIHRDDGAAFIVHLIRQMSWRRPEPLYVVTDNQPLAMYELLQWLAREQKIDITSVAAPHASGNKRLSNQRMLDSGYQFIYPDFKSGYSALLASIP
ncbi:Nucleoside-diphosphate-sugar epimerase [Methylobacillus rhizosphaerae]|uniref:Nucleoside-diphosphate-sugar epimerase n=1 Tax=Methylobacillus rhizosphaerae TaxID=551994 RepID=A0A239AN02_9PROT|nr:SDR family oxidoreductase [Methylobacillus rhizosphaerae]SNR96368.1 Nucleoside-diphosphate-sugar epimerase [Methylobacillus rhizosphaerae]